MKLEKVNSYPVFQTNCYTCARKLISSRDVIWADLDGKAFEAYYCELCKQFKTGELEENKNWHLTYNGPTALCGSMDNYRIHTSYANYDLDKGEWCVECKKIFKEKENEI